MTTMGMLPCKVFFLLAAIAVTEANFNIEGKIALITGGAQGIGYATIESLLQAGVRGVTLVDKNIAKGRMAAKSLNAKYGYGRVIFAPADVSNENMFEDSFKVSLEHWKGVDIVFNNAGVFNENDPNTTIDINIVGVVHGTLLGFKYMSKGNGGKGGVIINASSNAGLDAPYYGPVYVGTKTFVLQLGRALGHPTYYDYNMIRVITVCFGSTSTTLINLDSVARSMSNELAPHLREAVLVWLTSYPPQSSNSVGDGIRDVIRDGSSGSVWVIEGDELPYEVDFPNRQTMRKNYQ